MLTPNVNLIGLRLIKSKCKTKHKTSKTSKNIKKNPKRLDTIKDLKRRDDYQNFQNKATFDKACKRNTFLKALTIAKVQI